MPQVADWNTTWQQGTGSCPLSHTDWHWAQGQEEWVRMSNLMAGISLNPHPHSGVDLFMKCFTEAEETSSWAADE